jgi:hypothetical protein
VSDDHVASVIDGLMTSSIGAPHGAACSRGGT